MPKWQGLRVVPIGAGDVRTLAPAGLEVAGGTWVPDGKHLLVRGREPGRGWRVFVLDGEGGAPKAVTPEGVVDCVAGREQVVCVGSTERVTLYPLGGGEPKEGPGLERGASSLRLSDDGTSLFVAPARATRTAPLRIERIDLATGRRALVHEIRPADMAGVWIFYPALVTSDGRGYAYSYYQWLHSLYLADGLR